MHTDALSFRFLVCYVATPLALELQQERMQVARSNFRENHVRRTRVCWRVEFLLKSDIGYPGNAGFFFIHDGKPWEFPLL